MENEKCPAGLEFGKDHDSAENCDTCPERQYRACCAAYVATIATEEFCGSVPPGRWPNGDWRVATGRDAGKLSSE